jgi:hypothetical protein
MGSSSTGIFLRERMRWEMVWAARSLLVLVVLFGCCFLSFRAAGTNRSAPPSVVLLALGSHCFHVLLRYERWRETSSWARTGGAGPSQAAGRGRRGRRAA